MAKQSSRFIGSPCLTKDRIGGYLERVGFYPSTRRLSRRIEDKKMPRVSSRHLSRPLTYVLATTALLTNPAVAITVAVIEPLSIRLILIVKDVLPVTVIVVATIRIRTEWPDWSYDHHAPSLRRGLSCCRDESSQHQHSHENVRCNSAK